VEPQVRLRAAEAVGDVEADREHRRQPVVVLVARDRLHEAEAEDDRGPVLGLAADRRCQLEDRGRLLRARSAQQDVAPDVAGEDEASAPAARGGPDADRRPIVAADDVGRVDRGEVAAARLRDDRIAHHSGQRYAGGQGERDVAIVVHAEHAAELGVEGRHGAGEDRLVRGVERVMPEFVRGAERAVHPEVVAEDRLPARVDPERRVVLVAVGGPAAGAARVEERVVVVVDERQLAAGAGRRGRRERADRERDEARLHSDQRTPATSAATSMSRGLVPPRTPR
jgi:hypothetical protein